MTDTPITLSDTPVIAEFRATQALGLDDSPNIEEFVQPPNAQDRRRFKALQRKTPDLVRNLTVDDLKRKRIHWQIIETVRTFLAGKPSLIGHLGASVLASASADELRATPSVFLQKVLSAASTEDLTERLLKTLKWYGARVGEKAPASVRHQLACKAICLYLHAPSADEPQEVAGFRWDDPAHWGKSYQTLRADFEQHLLDTQRVANRKEAILLARVYETRLSKDFAVRDIPAELPYKSSLVWVNFMHGVLLADEPDEDRSQPLSFQQLVDLPLKRSTDASPEQLQDIARLRLIPALEWAICKGIVQSRPTFDYDQNDMQVAITALDSHNERLTQAVLALTLPCPDRMNMAKEAKDRLFGAAAFESDGRKLLADEHDSNRFMDSPSFKVPGHAFLDVYADGQFDSGKKWFVTAADGKTRTDHWISVDHQRGVQSQRKDLSGVYRQQFFYGRQNTLPEINNQFESDFKKHLSSIRNAYKTLISSLLNSLPLADRQALEQGKVRVLSLLSKKSKDKEQVRARKGFVLQVIQGEKITYYELIPSAGFIRCRPTLRVTHTSDGVVEDIAFHTPVPGQSTALDLSMSLRLDWSAHLDGKPPVEGAYCVAILSSVGEVPDAAPAKPEITPPLPRLDTVADCIASNFLYVDEKALNARARGITTFDTLRDRPESIVLLKELAMERVKQTVPFWSNIEDIASGDTFRIIRGSIGLGLEVVGFVLPIGKFLSGCVRLIRVATGASHLALKASLPAFSKLASNLLISSLKNLNPLGGVRPLLKMLGNGAWKGLKITSQLGIRPFRKLAHTDSYRLNHNLPQAVDPGRWRPLTPGDQLATINGIDDVLVRNTSTVDLQRFHLVDPVTSLPYGPRLSRHGKNFVQGRSTFKTQPLDQSRVVTEVPEHARIHELLEVDGSTTMLIDGTPYRLDGNQLRRADMINDQARFKALPCRVRRAPDAVCKTVYVTRDPAPLPENPIDETKGWAPWFGDIIYSPAIRKQPLWTSAIKRYKSLDASLQLQQGIFARIKVNLPYEQGGKFDTLEVGAILVTAKDNSKHYVFTRLSDGDFYINERPAVAIPDSFTLNRAVSSDLVEELKTVYTGSLNANNIARIHGVEQIEHALKTMDEIAIPIGGHITPPDTLKLLKVDTTPAEAVMFDHSTRMIVSKLETGAASWSRSKDAPEALRKKTAEIFDTLFTEKVVNVTANSDLKINQSMLKLQRLLPRKFQTENPRNIAYADIVTSTGKREVYVSVSGGQGLTGKLPLFEQLGRSDSINVNDITYFNVDAGQTFARTSLNVSPDGKLLAIPHTIKDVNAYTAKLTSRPTSLDSEAKLISVLRQKYPDNKMIKSIDVATTLSPCNSCAVVLKEFAYDGAVDGLKVLWG
ncbi:deaminase domain-containing protein [Pseudomonas baetica]|uniref:deaminase domain-containing protein n=1 Tax=Pseudomonas baetica TaxID=674054 RepID=UPI002871DD00|nr:deaminase domain-containing protein [Pseudomonas baetica]MDR9862841.1 deaminase domain-containing protein [Pseudomonas baetica]